MGLLCYLAEPIDQATDHTFHRAGLVEMLTLGGHIVYSPRNAFGVGQDPTPHAGVEAVNRSALDEADVLIAAVPKGVPSVGVPREIEAFAQAGKPWAVITDHDRSFSLLDAPFRVQLGSEGCYDELCLWVDGQKPQIRLGPSGSALLFSKDDEYDGQLPTRAHPGDAGLDLYAACDTLIPYDSFRDIPCGVRVALPDGVWARIVGRSSTLRQRSLLVSEGIIDTGYRGPLFAGVRNLGPKAAEVAKGDRIAQLVLMPNLAAMFHPAWASRASFEAIPHDGRGSSGFGSSGR